MKYDFDKVISRRETNCEKWDVLPNELPMWVADMDFETAPAVKAALERRVAHGIFGYAYVTDEWRNAYVNWWKNRHGFEMQPEWLMFCTGVIPALSSIVRKLTTPNEKVIIQTPVYNNFFNSIENNGARVLQNPLINDNDVFSMDFADLEAKMADPQASLMILCNPQNPSGTIWDRETLKKVGDLAVKYGVTVIADEIHCDLTVPGTSYIPFGSVSENCLNCSITCISPTKTFNIAGLSTSAIAVKDAKLRHKVWRAINTDEVAEPNALAVDATVAAFNEGGEWLDELNAYIAENRKITEDFIANEIPGVSAVKAQATYLVWINLSGLDIKVPEGKALSSYVADRLRADTGLFLNKGTAYGLGGENYLRLNIACPRATLMDGLNRLKQGIELLTL